MPWKERNGGARYYYKSIRQGKRVRSEYQGAGIFAEASAAFHAGARAERQALRATERAGREGIREAAAIVAAHNRELELAAWAILEAAGYHRHDRGQWRRRRTPMLTPNGTATQNAATPAPMPKRKGSDLAKVAERAWIAQAAGENPDVQAALARRLEELRAELEGPQPSAVERLVAERAALCWFHVQIAEVGLQVAQQEARSVAGILFREKTLDSAHRRYLSALRTLAAVRKLALPAIQVNVAETQVNVAGG